MQRLPKIRTIDEVMRDFLAGNPHLTPAQLQPIRKLVIDIRTEMTLSKVERIHLENNFPTEKSI